MDEPEHDDYEFDVRLRLTPRRPSPDPCPSRSGRIKHTRLRPSFSSAMAARKMACSIVDLPALLGNVE